MLSDTVNTYLSVRRAVGFKLKTIEKYLASYASFAAARGDLFAWSARRLSNGLRWAPPKRSGPIDLMY
jgi:hypothetical protein